MTPDIRSGLRSEAVRVATATLRQTTTSSYGFDEARRELAWWARSRMDALKARSPTMLRGSALCASYSGYVELVPMEIPEAGPGQVTVLTEISAINVGTDRAQYLKMPNTTRLEGATPGGSLAGVVCAVGRRVAGIEVGQRVALSGVPHASIVTVPALAVLAIPDGVGFSEAALVLPGKIAAQGIRLANLAAEEHFGVVGLGIIGAMTLRLAVAAGARAEAVVTTSRAKEPLALASGAQTFLTTDEEQAAVESLELPIVFEVTGSPQALSTAVAMTAPGGRVVLLGSSRGITEAMPVAEIRAKGLTLIGAHVDTIRQEAQSRGDDAVSGAERSVVQRYLDVAAVGEARFDDLYTRVIDPREAAILYRDIVADSSIVGAAIDWSRLPDADRLASSSIVRPPDLRGRGVAYDEPKSRRRRRSLLEYPDPLAAASGNLRFGMLGCGDISPHNAGAIAAAPNARLVACFDPVADLADEICSAYGAERMDSAEALVAHPNVDAVLISVPHHLHESLALLAIEAGRHVVVEKPLATDVRGACAIVSAAERAGVTLSTAFPQRYDPTVLLGRHLIASGALGELRGSLVRVLMDKSPAYWFGGYSGRAHSTWRFSREKAGGGVLIMNACHYVDMVRHLAGVEVSAVSSLSTTEPGMEVEDAITVAMGYANGATGSIVASSGVRGTMSNEVQLWGRDGHLVIEPRGRFFSLRHVDQGRSSRWQQFDGLAPLNGRMVYISRLATAIDRGDPPDIGAADGLAVQAIIEAAYRSAATGAVIDPGQLIAAGPS